MAEQIKFEPRVIPEKAMEEFQGRSYGHTFPKATYSPWFDDEKFMATYHVIKNHTLVDMYRLFELWSVLESTSNAGGDIVEVGVWRGGSGCLMAFQEQLLKNDSTVYLCDTFEGVVKASKEDSHYSGGEHEDTNVDNVEKLITKLGLGNVRLLKGTFPEETASELRSDRVRLLHIDVDVYQSAHDILEFMWDRIPSGGVVVFDDYGFYQCNGITKLVNAIKKKDHSTFIHNLNGHGILIKR